MARTELYVVRHGKTMFNTLQRVQGWCDTPLTAQVNKESIILGLVSGRSILWKQYPVIVVVLSKPCA